MLQCINLLSSGFRGNVSSLLLSSLGVSLGFEGISSWNFDTQNLGLGADSSHGLLVEGSSSLLSQEGLNFAKGGREVALVDLGDCLADCLHLSNGGKASFHASSGGRSKGSRLAEKSKGNKKSAEHVDTRCDISPRWDDVKDS